MHTKETLCSMRGSTLRVLHCISEQGPSILLVSSSPDRIYLTHSSPTGRVYMKVVPVLLRNGNKSLKTYVILDGGAQRSIILQAETQHLDLKGREESLALRTIRHDVAHLRGASVDFEVSPQCRPEVKYTITGAFTVPRLALTDQSYPTAALQRRYHHLRGIPLPSFNKAYPLLLIGSDYTSLITAKEPICLGPASGPAAVHMQLGWVLQGPDGLLNHQIPVQQCLFTAVTSSQDCIYQHVERLWQLDMQREVGDSVTTGSGSCGCLGGKDGAGKHQRSHVLCHPPSPDERCTAFEGK